MRIKGLLATVLSFTILVQVIQGKIVKKSLKISLHDESYNKTLKISNIVYHLHERVFVQISPKLINHNIKIIQCKLTTKTHPQNDFLLLNESSTKSNKIFGPLAYFEDGGDGNEARFSFDSGLLETDTPKMVHCQVSVHTGSCNGSYRNCLDSVENISLVVPTITCKNGNRCQDGCYVKSRKEVCNKRETELNFFNKLSSLVSNLTKKRKSCGEDQFLCWDGTCLPQEVRCNNTKECPDDSDEVECTRVSFSKDQCGKIPSAPKMTITSRIVGGKEATRGSWPWQVYLVINRKTSCGGSIISSRWILTAAHCFDGFNNPEVTVYVGISNLNHPNFYTRSFSSEKIILHKSYSKLGAPVYDIALIKVKEIRFNDHIQPICLSSLNTEFAPGTSCVATGWGRLADKGPSPSTLQQVYVPLVDYNTCRRKYSSRDIDRTSHICAGDVIDGGIDSCTGDSGGPLVCLFSESTWMQVGITSFGIGCADKRYPGVYTKVSQMHRWIVKETDIQQFPQVDICSSNSSLLGSSGEFFSINIQTFDQKNICLKQIKVPPGSKGITLTAYRTNKYNFKGQSEYCGLFEIIDSTNASNILLVDLCQSSRFTYFVPVNHIYLKFYKNKVKLETPFRVTWQARYINGSSSLRNKFSKWLEGLILIMSFRTVLELI